MPQQVLAAQTEMASEEEEHAPVMLPGAGFSYAFAAKKVSLRNVEDNLYDNGLISVIRKDEKNGLTIQASAAENVSAGEGSDEAEDASEDTTDEEDNRSIAETQLTPVQAREQAVVNAVSETQGIQIDSATATILSATAVTVVSDANIAVQLAQMVDRREAQMKLDQGVISAGEAEALLASSQEGNNSAEGASEDTSENASGEDGTAASDTDPEASGKEEAESGTDSEASVETGMATDSNGNEIVVAQVNDYINVRADADEESDIVGKLYNGSVAKVLGRTGNGWARVRSGDVTGYIREEYVATGDTAQQLADSVTTKKAVVTTETLRVRAAAQADSDVITLIGQGQTLDILEETDGWYKVNTEDGEGYISADFADVEDVYPEAVSRAQEEAEEAAAEASRKEEEEAAKAASNAAAGTAGTSGSKKKSGGSGALNTYTGGSGSGSASGQAVANYALQFCRQSLCVGRLQPDKRNGLLRLYHGGVRKLRCKSSALHRLSGAQRNCCEFPGRGTAGRSDSVLRSCRDLPWQQPDCARIEPQVRHYNRNGNLPQHCCHPKNIQLISETSEQKDVGRRPGVFLHSGPAFGLRGCLKIICQNCTEEERYR